MMRSKYKNDLLKITSSSEICKVYYHIGYYLLLFGKRK